MYSEEGRGTEFNVYIPAVAEYEPEEVAPDAEIVPEMEG